MIYFKSKKFILKSLEAKDAADIARNINNERITKNLAVVPFPYTLRDAKDWTRKSLKSSEDKLILSIVVDGEVVGVVDLRKIVKNHKAEMGYWLAEKCWGKGIMSQVVKFVCSYGFRKFKLKRICANVYAYNLASKKVLEKNGFQEEGIMRKHLYRDGKYFDVFVMAKVK